MPGNINWFDVKFLVVSQEDWSLFWKIGRKSFHKKIDHSFARMVTKRPRQSTYKRLGNDWRDIMLLCI